MEQELGYRPARILIVDDCPDMRASLRILLGLWGHDAEEAADGPSALALARSFRPDAVLLDLGLPRIDGLEVARRMRRIAGLEKCLLIAVTGYGREQDVAQAREAGFDLHLIKPLDLEALEHLLQARAARLPA